MCKICTCADYIKDEATLCKTEASAPSKTEVASSGAPEFPRSLRLWCCAERASQSIHVLHKNHCVQVAQLQVFVFCVRGNSAILEYAKDLVLFGEDLVFFYQTQTFSSVYKIFVL